MLKNCECIEIELHSNREENIIERISNIYSMRKYLFAVGLIKRIETN